MQNTAVFQLEQVSKSFGNGDEQVRIFRQLDFTVRDGEFIALMGPSGCGKTTLLNMLGGIEMPDRGHIRFRGERIDDYKPATLNQWRARHVGFVFQAFNLLPMFSAARNVELPLLLTSLSRAERKRRIETALDLMGLSQCANRTPKKLSGGQQQRVAIARALVSDTSVLLCDEPTGNLDKQSSNEVLTLLKMLNRDFNKTIVMVTHDPNAATFATRTCHLDKGSFIDEPQQNPTAAACA
ncbi:ABC transporter ATP-binding protein [Bowmanella dokdonensis]|uniref:ABC transporter ATP-binding protein n=1 Tax=Bowmanella dokdonensis TaxID=751969 RepID=A0A939DK03_9ALTE|nr:ABC transporter ATP-binding protein [Bowmanella dokdonensis]MBN7823944.1 ABC transporter ATP-binding protein [Bowmanella dokdonensis]